MRKSIESYKESLSRIAHEVLVASEEYGETGPVSTCHKFHLSPTLSQRSSHANGTDLDCNENARYKVDILKLQESESEIKALSFNYAALLKEKEEQLCDLRQKNDELRRCLEVKEVDECLSRDENIRTPNYSITSEFSKTNGLREELDLSLSELRRLKDELNKKYLEIEQLNESMVIFNSAVQSLEMEKLGLMIEKNAFEEKLNFLLNNKSEINDADGLYLLKESKDNEIEERMALKIKELEKILKETCEERDKASQESMRLKQHLLDKSN